MGIYTHSKKITLQQTTTTAFQMNTNCDEQEFYLTQGTKLDGPNTYFRLYTIRIEYTAFSKEYLSIEEKSSEIQFYDCSEDSVLHRETFFVTCGSIILVSNSSLPQSLKVLDDEKLIDLAKHIQFSKLNMKTLLRIQELIKDKHYFTELVLVSTNKEKNIHGQKWKGSFPSKLLFNDPI